MIILQDNYVEIVSILKETQEQLKEAQKQRDSGADVVSVFDSLAYEIESSVARHRRASDYFRREQLYKIIICRGYFHYKTEITNIRY